MIQVTSPGLPSWPKLWLDKANNRSLVVCKYPSWRSYEWAIGTMNWVVVIANLVLILVAWEVLQTPDLSVRILLVFVAWAISAPLLTLAIKASAIEPLAKYIFPTKTKFYVTENSVVFKSRLYAAMVVVWRQWKNNPLRFRFVIQLDPEAAKYLEERRQRRKQPNPAIKEASIVSLVITTPQSGEIQQLSGHDSLQRAIPITEIAGRDAQKFSTVVNAALQLIQGENTEAAKSTSIGVDIDAA